MIRAWFYDRRVFQLVSDDDGLAGLPRSGLPVDRCDGATTEDETHLWPVAMRWYRRSVGELREHDVSMRAAH
jgi:hypothetical protein